MENQLGNSLYKKQKDSLKNGLGFTGAGILIFILADFLSAKTFVLLVGVCFVFIGTYQFIIKRNDGVEFFSEGILIKENNKAKVIKETEIANIEFQKSQGGYYPVVHLKDGQKYPIKHFAKGDFKEFLTIYQKRFK